MNAEGKSYLHRCGHSIKKAAESLCGLFYSVGMTGFEPATTRPPDVYSNRAELHPVSDWGV